MPRPSIRPAIPAEERVAFARQVLTWKAERLKNREMAERAGLTQGALESRMHKPWFKLLVEQIQAAGPTEPEKASAIDAAHGKIVGARTKMHALMAGPGMEFLESCFKKDARGEWVSKGDARYAVDRLLPATGLNEVEDSRRRLGDIKLGVIMAQQAAIRASDSKLHVIEVKALPAPARAPELDGDDEGNDIDDLGLPETPTPVPAE